VLRFVGLCFGTLVRLFRGRQSLLLENLALRQQLVALKRRHPRPSLGPFEKLFWVIARRVWSSWKHSLIIVTPETVVRWHRAGFLVYWRLISRARRQVGRKQTPKEVRELIFRMVVENPTWGAPRIHGELLMLGCGFCKRTISRWMKRAPRDPEPAKRCLAFLRNHREVIAAMNFCTVPTITFGALYCFFVINHSPPSPSFTQTSSLTLKLQWDEVFQRTARSQFRVKRCRVDFRVKFNGRMLEDHPGKSEDYVKATQRIYRAAGEESFIDLPSAARSLMSDLRHR
jgi:hypothetical protein